MAHVHFAGAGGNIAAGKYNDGSPANRPLLAQRLADGMKLAWDSQKKQPLRATDVGWQVAPVAMPVRKTLDEKELLAKLADAAQKQPDRIRAARDLVFVRRMSAGHTIPLGCLRLGTARVLHLPGELFVEYQLAAQRMRPDGFRRDGRLRGVRPRLHRHGDFLRPGRLRDRPRVACCTASRDGID
ncbi:MAG: hypothetical protein HC814_01070 [Rhodobacteraceae bacterium]|nr:hypothetical protein [Paracoccaceae bacterium]